MLPFRVRVDLGATAMKGCSAFPKAPASLEPHHQIVLCHIQDPHAKCSRCILQPRQLGQGGSFNPLKICCRAILGPSPNRLGKIRFNINRFFFFLLTVYMVSSNPVSWQFTLNHHLLATLIHTNRLSHQLLSLWIEMLFVNGTTNYQTLLFLQNFIFSLWDVTGWGVGI